MPEARGLHGQFSFGEAKSHFNLPAPHVNEDDLPGILDRFERFVGQQVKRRASFAWARNN